MIGDKLYKRSVLAYSQPTAMILGKLSKNSVNSYSVTDQITAMIRKIILKGELKPGDRLNEVQISEALEISRSPVREAIQRLVKEGLVVLVPRKGAFIRKLNSKEVEDLFEARVTLETKAASLAAQRVSESQLNKFSSILDRTESALINKESSKYSLVFYSLDFDFHLKIATFTQNAVLEAMIQELNAKLRLVRHRSGAEISRAREAFEEHKKVFECIKRRDSDAAFKTMQRHLMTAREAILKIIPGESD
jgi:DNA-binding GntR family transcriptional regulator